MPRVPSPQVCREPWSQAGLNLGNHDSRLLFFFPIRGQVQQQDTSSERIDHYPGLSGKGLCARALYDYQAGNVLQPCHLKPQGPRSGGRICGLPRGESPGASEGKAGGCGGRVGGCPAQLRPPHTLRAATCCPLV